MVKISNGAVTLEVTLGSYKNFFQRSGFVVLSTEDDVFASGGKPTQPDEENTGGEEISQAEKDLPIPADGNEEPEYDPEDEREPDLSEIPLSEQDFYQLRAYADQLGLDHRGIRSQKELRAMIRNYLKG